MLRNNPEVGDNPKTIKFLINEYLSSADIKSACEKIKFIHQDVQNDYLDKFTIYCFINNDRKDEAQLLLDLSKERVYAGEAVKATFKFAYKVGINPLDVNLEEFKPQHFWKKELSNPKAKEEYGYIVQTISYLLFPQIAGIQTLEEQTINVATRQRKTNFIIWKKVLSNENELEVLLKDKFKSERGRINCSLWVESGKWRWLGIQYVIAEY